MIVNPELGAYRSHYTRFGHAQELFFFVWCLALGISRPPNFYRLFYPKFLDLYASIHGNASCGGYYKHRTLCWICSCLVYFQTAAAQPYQIGDNLVRIQNQSPSFTWCWISAYILVQTSSRRSPSFVISVLFWTVNSQWPATLPRSQASVIISLDVWSKWEESWGKTLQLVLCGLSLSVDCNAILAGLTQSMMAPFQRMQKAAVKMVKRLSSRAYITEAQRNLHWLPIKYRVIYKLCILMHMVHIGCGLSALPGRSRLCFSSRNRYEIPVIHHKIGERAFSYAGHAASNSLPTTLTNFTDTQTFKSSLKTYLFQLANNLWLLHVQRLWS